jgi:hypothetical protein
MKTNAAHIERTKLHQATLEAKVDRLIELLEKRNEGK